MTGGGSVQQLHYLGSRRLEWREVEMPTLRRPTDALVRPLAVATCDLDTLIVNGQFPVPGPFAFGHECVAEIVSVGDAVSLVRPGDRVIVPFQLSCGECEECRRGRTANCGEFPPASMFGLGPLSGGDLGGFLSDLVLVPCADHMLVPIPDGIPPRAIASLSDNVADAWRTVGPQLAAEPGSNVLICGGDGSIGLYAVAMAAALGAGRVDWIGGHERAERIAAELGANVVQAEDLGDRGPYPITVDAGGSRESLQRAVRWTAADGMCTSCGIYIDPQLMELGAMYTRGINFYTGRVHARSVIPHVLDLVAAGLIHPELVTGRVVSWDDAEDSLSALDTKIVIVR